MPLESVNGTQIHYRWDGPANGPVVMMAHSLGAGLAMWDGQVPALTAAGCRVLRYDHRGHGGSAAPEQAYTMEMLAADAVGLMDALGLEKVCFVGLSLGGMVGQFLGASHGERLLGLVLSSTSAHMPPPELWEERIQTVQAHGTAAVVEATLERWITPAGRQRLPEAVQAVRGMILSTPPVGFVGCCAAIRDMDLREAIRAVTVPTLILVGEHDQGTPVAMARFIHERIAVSQLVVVADAAHLVNVEQADVFNRSVVPFLKDQRP
jgi:3-oxoadipate enol-lactonase